MPDTVRGVSNDAAALARAFRARTDREPLGVWAAPGRVNLIGEHTDYNDGYVMPFALPQRVLIAAAPRRDGIWSVTSLNMVTRSNTNALEIYCSPTSAPRFETGIR